MPKRIFPSPHYLLVPLLLLAGCADGLPTSGVDSGDPLLSKTEPLARRAALVLEMDIQNQRLVVTDGETGETRPATFRGRISVFEDGTATGNGTLRDDAGQTRYRFTSGSVACPDRQTIVLGGLVNTPDATGRTGWVPIDEATAVVPDSPVGDPVSDCIIFDIVGSGVHNVFDAEGEVVWYVDPCSSAG